MLHLSNLFLTLGFDLFAFYLLNNCTKYIDVRTFHFHQDPMMLWKLRETGLRDSTIFSVFLIVTVK